MNTIYIVIKKYSNNLAKKQPWYSVKKLEKDLSDLKFHVVIISSLRDIPDGFDGSVIKLFGIKDILRFKSKPYRLIYLFTSPMITLYKFISLGFYTIVKNWKYLYVIFITSLIPRWVFTKTLDRASLVLVVSDSLEDYFYSVVNVYKYIPFISDNWDMNLKTIAGTSGMDKKLTVGYFGPPYLTRYFDRVVDFFVWLEKHDHNYKTKLVTRIDEHSLKSVEQKYMRKLCADNSAIVSGFLSRNELTKEILEIDVMILPFRVVMEELPIVVLESLELGIPVITTKESGVHLITSGQKNILILDGFGTGNYSDIISFINSCQKDNFNHVIDKIRVVNQIALDKI
jgi:glycosyltransferase involved in cell wall biosynthesis